MNCKYLTIDCASLSERELHAVFKEKLGFPDFYGKNWDALIDCLSYMRYPEAGMSEVTLGEDGVLVIECKGLSEARFDVQDFLGVVEAVNDRELLHGKTTQILLNLIKS